MSSLHFCILSHSPIKLPEKNRTNSGSFSYFYKIDLVCFFPFGKIGPKNLGARQFLHKNHLTRTVFTPYLQQNLFSFKIKLINLTSYFFPRFKPFKYHNHHQQHMYHIILPFSSPLARYDKIWHDPSMAQKNHTYT